MNSKIVGITAILATFVILAYAVFAANQNAVDNSQACDNVPEDAPARENANENSVLSSCGVQCPPPDGQCDEGDNPLCEPACAA